MLSTARAQTYSSDVAASANPQAAADSFSGPDEPVNRLQQVEVIRVREDALFPVTPSSRLRCVTDRTKQHLYDATCIKTGLIFTNVFQGVSDALPNQDHLGNATDFTGIAKWELLNRGDPDEGAAWVNVESRFDYGTTGPEALGTFSLGSAIGTADTFDGYPVAFVVRNLYWRQGSEEAGWIYRIGKISPDQLLATSPYLDPQQTFLPSGSIGRFAIALPDSGLGAAGGFRLNDRVALAGLVSDANGDRFNFGEISAGDYFKAVELHVDIAPHTDDPPTSKLTFWHTDGTQDGMSLNGQLGPEGWGYYALLAQELSCDGRAIGILKYGQSFNGSAAYEQQFGAHFVLKNTKFQSDILGVALNWAQLSVHATRDEYHFEVFYRFPLFPDLDTSLSYQSVFTPALTREIDHASVLSLRLRTTF